MEDVWVFVEQKLLPRRREGIVGDNKQNCHGYRLQWKRLCVFRTKMRSRYRIENVVRVVTQLSNTICCYDINGMFLLSNPHKMARIWMAQTAHGMFLGCNTWFDTSAYSFPAAFIPCTPLLHPEPVVWVLFSGSSSFLECVGARMYCGGAVLCVFVMVVGTVHCEIQVEPCRFQSLVSFYSVQRRTQDGVSLSMACKGNVAQAGLTPRHWELHCVIRSRVSETVKVYQAKLACFVAEPQPQLRQRLCASVCGVWFCWVANERQRDLADSIVRLWTQHNPVCSTAL